MLNVNECVSIEHVLIVYAAYSPMLTLRVGLSDNTILKKIAAKLRPRPYYAHLKKIDWKIPPRMRSIILFSTKTDLCICGIDLIYV